MRLDITIHRLSSGVPNAIGSPEISKTATSDGV